MNGRYVVIALAALCGMWAGCSPVLRVDSLWGPGIRYSGLGTTYVWTDGLNTAFPSTAVENEGFDRMVRDLIDARLAGKGYVKAEEPPVDLWLRYRVGREVRQAGVGLGTWDQGVLAVDMLEPDTGRLIWCGTVQAKVDHHTPPHERSKTMRKAIRRVLDGLPDQR